MVAKLISISCLAQLYQWVIHCDFYKSSFVSLEQKTRLYVTKMINFTSGQMIFYIKHLSMQDVTKNVSTVAHNISSVHVKQKQPLNITKHELGAKKQIKL